MAWASAGPATEEQELDLAWASTGLPLAGTGVGTEAWAGSQAVAEAWAGSQAVAEGKDYGRGGGPKRSYTGGKIRGTKGELLFKSCLQKPKADKWGQKTK